MCGIPVAGFSIGGMPEMVNKENGYLADNVSPASLLEAIQKALILSPKKHQISEAAAEQFSPERQVREFMSLVKTMV
jgi:glycosyltransferase involved in cell wall biosynthesis